MELARLSLKEVLSHLNIRNHTHQKAQMNWYKNEEILRFTYPVVKQYSYGKSPSFEDEMARL